MHSAASRNQKELNLKEHSAGRRNQDRAEGTSRAEAQRRRERPRRNARPGFLCVSAPLREKIFAGMRDSDGLQYGERLRLVVDFALLTSSFCLSPGRFFGRIFRLLRVLAPMSGAESLRGFLFNEYNGSIMKTKKVLLLALLAFCTLPSALSTAGAQGTAFTYQGQLMDSGAPANGLYDIRTGLYPTNIGGVLATELYTNLAVPVSNGLFIISMDFGDVFTGASYWLQIGVRTNGVGATFTPLSPRVELTPSPYAIYAASAGSTALLNNYGSLNFFAGQNSGNSALSGSDNTGVGFGTLFSTTSGSYNTAQGVGALSANTSGSYGTADGVGALFSNTSGANNTAVGFDALLSNISGANNTATGTDALFSNTNGSQNTADGAGALFFNKTGGDNVAVGYQALLNNTNQSEDTAVGSQALLANTTGFQDTGLGYRALYGNTSGTYNTASGAFALSANTIGFFNTASGGQALESNLTGSNNVANGFQALWQNTSGSCNTADGSLALLENGSGSGNIALGYQAGYNILNGSDNIDIGNLGVSADTAIIRIGTPGVQTTTFIAGVITGNGGGLINLNASQMTSGTIPLAQLPAAVALLSDPGTGNFFAGQYAGNLAVTGQYNVGSGDGALSGNTSGSLNAAFGAAALGFNETGSNNTATGYAALAFNQTGSYNTASGSGALTWNSGNYNTAVGAYALGSGVGTGGGNTGSGAYALSDVTSGYNNTAAGFWALADDSSGFDNVAVGYEALFYNASGVKNAAGGTYALENNIGGSYNTAFGYESLQKMTTGTGNIALGTAAGQNLIAGTNNIYIGNTGSSADNEVIRIGGSQTVTYLAGAQTYVNGVIALDGSDTENGLEYAASGMTGVPGSAGPFLFGWNGGALGTTGPTSVNLSWDYSGDIWVSNNLSTATLTIRGGSDLAEPFKLSPGSDNVPQGSVMVIDGENPGQLKVSTQAYDTRVAGVISGANGINPGIQMQQQGLLDGGKNVALTGRVYVLADAAGGAIQPGDLLTTSGTPGHAMKVGDHAKAQGAILGKAMSGLKEGRGMVLVLVTLQ
jgi:hypothetical protein